MKVARMIHETRERLPACRERQIRKAEARELKDWIEDGKDAAERAASCNDPLRDLRLYGVVGGRTIA